MAARAFYLKWRPMTFEEVVGQQHVTHTLRNAVSGDRVAHAYLFSGPRGIGKTSMARLLAKALNCLADDPLARPCNQCQPCIAVNEGRFLDLIEMDAASHTGVDDVRELRDRIAFAPNEGRYKVYIIDEVHRFSGSAFDALLKTIEEPPAHAVFVLATTEIHKVPQTILSRCQRFDFRRISLEEIIERLWQMVEAEGLQAEPAALELIARQATGSLRDAISLLDQISEPGEVLTLDLAQAILGTAAGQVVQDLTAALIGGDLAAGLDIINHTLDEGADPRQLSRQMIEYLRLLMLVQTGGTELVEAMVSPEELAVLAEQAEQLPRRALFAALRRFNEAASDKLGGWQPQLPLELAFAETVETLYAAPEEALAPQAALVTRQGANRATRPPSSVPAQPVQGVAGTPPETPPEYPPEEHPPEPPALGMPPLTDIHARWEELLEVSRQIEPTGMIQALLRSCTPYRLEGDVLIVLAGGEVLRDKVELNDNRRLIEAALQKLFGQAIRVRCQLQTTDRQKPSRELDDLLASNGLVSFAVNELGGRVRDFRRIDDGDPDVEESSTTEE